MPPIYLDGSWAANAWWNVSQLGPQLQSDGDSLLEKSRYLSVFPKRDYLERLFCLYWLFDGHISYTIFDISAGIFVIQCGDILRHVPNFKQSVLSKGEETNEVLSLRPFFLLGNNWLNHDHPWRRPICLPIFLGSLAHLFLDHFLLPNLHNL